MTAAVDPEWKTLAACRSTPTGMMYPPPGDSVALRAALSICAGCPVRRACLRYAIEADEMHGVWGGTSGKQRWRLAGRVRRGHRIDDVVASVPAPRTV